MGPGLASQQGLACGEERGRAKWTVTDGRDICSTVWNRPSFATTTSLLCGLNVCHRLQQLTRKISSTDVIDSSQILSRKDFPDKASLEAHFGRVLQPPEEVWWPMRTSCYCSVLPWPRGILRRQLSKHCIELLSSCTTLANCRLHNIWLRTWLGS